VTCLSRHSRNRYVGEQIGKGRKLDDVIGEMNMIAEGVLTSKAVALLSSRLGVDMPITQEVNAMLFENKPAQQAILDLMNREPKSEHY
jgi:glycerol-3-phosphate dehydrogenase (NAD(P)+)